MLNLPLSLSLAVLLGISALTSLAPAADSSDKAAPVTTLTKDDAAFVHTALISEMAEIKISELALKRGLLGADRDFAQRIVDEHGKLRAELKAIAGTKGVEVPAMLDDKAQAKVDELSKKTDGELPEAYLKGEVECLKRSVGAFKEAGEDAKDVDVKNFASKHLIDLQTQHGLAQELVKKH